MLILKYICFVVALITTGLYLNNYIADITNVLTWRTSIGGEQQNPEEQAAKFASMRFILSIIMALTWGVVFIL
jgi:hypothetical protein